MNISVKSWIKNLFFFFISFIARRHVLIWLLTFSAINVVFAQQEVFEVEPNDTENTATVIDQGFVTYRGSLAIDGSDTDFWDIPIAVSSGQISLTFTDLSNVSGLSGDVIAGLKIEERLVGANGDSREYSDGTQTSTWDPSRGSLLSGWL